MNRLDAIRQRLDAVTPGPWEINNDGSECYVTDGKHRNIARFFRRPQGTSGHPMPREENVALFVHAPQDLRDLLELADALKAYNAADEAGMGSAGARLVAVLSRLDAPQP